MKLLNGEFWYEFEVCVGKVVDEVFVNYLDKDLIVVVYFGVILI